MTRYPTDRKRCGFAIRFLRWLHESGMVNAIGPESTAILSAVVCQEDAIHYSRAVEFWNPQLMTRCGFRNEKTFISARKRTVEAGLLAYDKGSKTRPATYYVIGPTVESTGHNPAFAVDSTGNAALPVNPTNEPAVIREEQGNIQTPTPTEQKSPSNTLKESDPAFLAFWQAYPKREGKRTALTAFPKAVRRVRESRKIGSEAAEAIIVKAANVYARHKAGTERQFIKQPATWLNGDCWDDELPEPDSQEIEHSTGRRTV